MEKSDRPEAFGVFKPVGHVVISFQPGADVDRARQALAQAGFDDVVHYTAPQMAVQAKSDIANAGVLASVGQEMNLVKAHLALAEQGYEWLVVNAPQDDAARRVADVVRPLGAERAQSYGRFVIEELIEHAHDEQPVFESPARGLDAQTPSGREEDR